MIQVPLTFDQLPSAVYHLRQEVSALRQLVAENAKAPVNSTTEESPLNLTQAAEFLGIAKQTIYQNIDQIPHRKRFGRLFFFKSELLAYLNAGEGHKI